MGKVHDFDGKAEVKKTSTIRAYNSMRFVSHLHCHKNIAKSSFNGLLHF